MQFTPVSQAYVDALQAAGDGSGKDRLNPVSVGLVASGESTDASASAAGVQLNSYISQDSNGVHMLNVDLNLSVKEGENVYNFLRMGFCFWDTADLTFKDCNMVYADISSRSVDGIKVEDGLGNETSTAPTGGDSDYTTADANINWVVNTDLSSVSSATALDAGTFKFEEDGSLRVNMQRALAPTGDVGQDISIASDASKTYKIQGYVLEYNAAEGEEPRRQVIGAELDWTPVTDAYLNPATED